MSSSTRSRTRHPLERSRTASKGRKPRLSRGGRIAAVATAALVVLGAVFAVSTRSNSGAGGQFPFAVGDPGPSQAAPAFTLASATGGTVALDDFRGQTVLLYFQEGLMCQPCWDQMIAIERDWQEFSTLGIDEMVTITTDPLDALAEKVRIEGLTRPVLSDPDLATSRQYDTNSYGMMGNSRNGHTFIVVGPDGQIRWRADYGGAPEYTMYLPVPDLIADLRDGLGAATGAS